MPIRRYGRACIYAGKGACLSKCHASMRARARLLKRNENGPTSDSWSHLRLGLMPSLLRSEMVASPQGSQGLPVVRVCECGGGGWLLTMGRAWVCMYGRRQRHIASTGAALSVIGWPKEGADPRQDTHKTYMYASPSVARTARLDVVADHVVQPHLHLAAHLCCERQ